MKILGSNCPRSMKTTLKAIMMMACVGIVAACQEHVEEDIVPEVPSLKFICSVENTLTKTILVDEDASDNLIEVWWNRGDVISVNGIEFTAQMEEAESAKTAVFSQTGAGDASGDDYKAFFPATLKNYELPSTWTYNGRFDMPMYACSTTNALSFSNICGVLAITVNNAVYNGVAIAKVHSINISSADRAMSGTFTIGENSEARLTTPNDNTKSVTLSCGDIATTADGITFYIPVPATAYGRLFITVNDGSADYCMATKEGKTITVERSKLYAFTFKKNYEATPEAEYQIKVTGASDTGNARH